MTQTKNKWRFALLMCNRLARAGRYFLQKVREIFCIDEKRTLQNLVICLPSFSIQRGYKKTDKATHIDLLTRKKSANMVGNKPLKTL